MISAVKLVLSIILFACLLEMPYGYFQLVRFLCFVGFGYLAYYNFETGKVNIGLLYILLALLFQPFLKVSLGRELWNVVDVIIGGWLIISLSIKK
jgi:hypothetical protein